MTGPTPDLPSDLDAGLRRLRLGAMRRLAPELLVTAKTQRWAPEEFLRTLIETEIASRLLDRLLHHAIIVATQGESYRMKQAHTRGTHTKTTTT